MRGATCGRRGAAPESAPVDGLFYYARVWLLHQRTSSIDRALRGQPRLAPRRAAYLLYALLRSTRTRAPASLIAAGVVLIRPANTSRGHTSHASRVPVLLCALALTLPLAAAGRAACVLVASFVLGYVRPEYMVLFAFAVAVALCAVVWCARSTPLKAAACELAARWSQ